MFSVKKSILLVLILSTTIGFSQASLSQKIERILNSKATDAIDDKEALRQFEQLLSQQNKASKTPELGKLYGEIGKQFYKLENNTKAIAYLKTAIQIQEIHKKTQLEPLNKTRNNLAWIYSYEENDNERFKILKKIIQDNGKDKYTFNARIDLAVLEARKGDYYSALSKLNVALAKNNTIDNDIKLRTAIIGIYGKMYENIFVTKKQSDFQIIKEHQLKITNDFGKTTLNEDDLFNAFNNLANVYEAFGKSDVALQLYQKVNDYFQKKGDVDKQLSALNNIGYLYSKQNKPKEAISCYQKVIANSTNNEQIATAYDNMGYFLNTSSAIKKIPYFEKAILTILESNSTSYSLPSLETIRNSGYQQDVMIYLVDLAYHYLQAYKEVNTKSYLQLAKSTLYRVDELVSLIRYESNTEQSKLFWIGKGVDSYVLAVEVCYYLKQPDEAFYFMEKNKALLLQENIKMHQAKLELDIPKTIQKREYKLHYELISLEKLFQQNSTNSVIKKKYNTKQKEFETFMDSLNSKYPDYVKIKKGIETISIQKATSELSKDECFVTYILSESKGFGLFCTNQEKLFFEINNVRQFQEKLKIVKNYMKQPILNKAEIAAFQKLGNDVFKTLFPFKDAFSKIRNKKIIIVADDSLLDLPFEALVVNPSKPIAASYLIQFAEVSYLQSFSVFEKIKWNQKQAKKKLLLFHPNQFNQQNLPDLVASNQVMQSLKIYSSSDIMIGEEATKDNFYDYCANYEIIHLNTHAGIDTITETPWISFQESKLNLDELYGIHNQAELVILDACKTNDGTNASGEGIISLSRGFFYNGSKSVLASLWNVNEKAGNDIITAFYSYLKEGKSKPKALQLAKLDYLKKHQYSEILPYYWASFTLTGSTTPIEISHKTPLIFYILPILLLFLAYYFAKRKRLF